MAQNLLTEITPVDPTSPYLLDIGSAHSLLNRRKGVIGILNNTTALSGKMMIMNVYCDNCSSNGKMLQDNLIEFMKGGVLEAFRNSAKGDLTIFDLANAPAPCISEARNIDLVSVTGEVLESYSISKLDGSSLSVSRLPAGSYFVRIRGGVQSYVLPFLKQ